MAFIGLDLVSIDHGYSKPWSSHPDASNARPMKTLFMAKFPRNRTLERTMAEPDLLLDVVSVPNMMPTSYDVTKARSVMMETEKQLGVLSSSDDRGDDWEDRINKSGWTQQQNRLFLKVNKILSSDRLSRLTVSGNVNEGVLRRNQVDKMAKRLRQTLATVKWETKLVQWLHGVLLDNLGSQALAGYIEALQTIKTKSPSLVDRMTAVGGLSVRSQQLTGDLMTTLLKKPWDPVQGSLSSSKMKKLPGNPLILVAPSGPTGSGSQQSKRMKYFSTQLANLGKVIPVLMHIVNNGSGVSIAQCLEHMIVAVKNKVAELRAHFVNRPIVLLGWNIGALVACHVALQETVSAVVCLGFPFTGVGGGRGDADDPFLDCCTPTLFVIGQHSNTCTIDQIEDLRERMRADNSLVLVGGADDNLCMSRAKKKREAVTQTMVDKTVLEEVSEFLGGVLSQGPMLQESVIVDLTDLEARKRRNSGKMTGPEDIDLEDYAQNNDVELRPSSPQGRLTIAKALRARGMGSSSSVDSPRSITSISSVMTSPIKVKRKYTKRKGLLDGGKAGGSTPGVPSPRKRFRSTPTPPVASPMTSLQSPQSAGTSPSVSGTTDLPGLLKSHPGALPTFRILTDESGQKTALFSSVQTAASSLEQPQLPATVVNLPSPAILGTSTASDDSSHLVAYKIEDYNKKFGDKAQVSETQTPDSILQKQTLTMENLLRSHQAMLKQQQEQQQQSTPATSTPISSLLSLARHLPVQITTASSVSSQIHQLLTNLARSQHLVTSSPSPTSSTSLNLAPPFSPIKSSSGTGVSSQSGVLTPIQLSQSGSPLQNSVPTLMSSLQKTTTYPSGNILRRLSSVDQTSITLQEPAVDKIPASQRLEFPEVPGLPSTAFSGTQTPETIDLTLSSSSGVYDGFANRPANVQTSYHITPTRTTTSATVTAMSQSMEDKYEDDMQSTSQPLALVVESCSGPGQIPEVTLIARPVSRTFNPQTVSVSTYQQRSGQVTQFSQTTEETLGKVSSMLESSPVIEKQDRQASVIDLTAGHSGPSCDHPQQLLSSGAGNVSISGMTPGPKSTVGNTKSSPAIVTSYTSTSKQPVGTMASTRTRKIRTPKQLNL